MTDTATAVKGPRTILFTHWGDEGLRGSERVLLDLLTHLNRDLYTPVLWCNTESMGAAATTLDIRTVVSPMPVLFGWDASHNDFQSYFRLIRKGEELVRRHDVRLIHANSGAPNQWMVPVSRRLRIPLVGHLHAVYHLRDRCTMLLHQVPLIVGCSEAVIQPFRADGIPRDRLRVVYNGINKTRLNTGCAAGLRDSLAVPETTLLIAAAGALVPIKGFDILIRALEAVRRRGIDAHLAIAGEGPERQTLQTLAADLGVSNQVHFLGQHPHVGAIFRDAADIVAVSSRIESFGLVVAEASAMGRPVVATRVGGIAEWTKDGETALLVPPDDPFALADALFSLAKDPQRCRELGARAMAHVLSRFPVERVARSFEELYAEMLTCSAASYGWSGQGFRMAPFARLGATAIRRRLRPAHFRRG